MGLVITLAVNQDTNKDTINKDNHNLKEQTATLQ